MTWYTHVDQVADRPVGQFDPVVAAHMAEIAAKLVYWEPDEMQFGAQALGYSTVEYASQGATQMAVLGSPSLIVVAWRGSSQLGDWYDDLSVKLVPWYKGCGRIHEGFERQFNRISLRYIESLTEMRGRYPQAPMISTGHSLGGPLAVQGFLRAFQYDMHYAACYPIEMPRMTDADGSYWIGKYHKPRVHRVVVIHKRGVKDIVTCLPPARWGYCHIDVTPRVYWDGQIFDQVKRWREYRRGKDRSWLWYVRFISRLIWRIRAHTGDYVVKTMVEQAESHLTDAVG